IATGLEPATATAKAAPAEVRLPARRWREILAGLPVRAELVVGLALLRVGQDLVGLVGLLEPVLGALRLVLVRMVLARELSVRALDVLRGSVAADTEDPVVILVF